MICFVQATDVTAMLLPEINRIRALYGRQPLCADNALSSIASYASDKQASMGLMHHVNGITDAIIDSGMLGAAENVAQNMADADRALHQWINSPGHMKNMMNPSYNSVAVRQSEGKGRNMYYSMTLGKSRDGCTDAAAKPPSTISEPARTQSQSNPQPTKEEVETRAPSKKYSRVIRVKEEPKTEQQAVSVGQSAPVEVQATLNPSITSDTSAPNTKISEDLAQGDLCEDDEPANAHAADKGYDSQPDPSSTSTKYSVARDDTGIDECALVKEIGNYLNLELEECKLSSLMAAILT